MVTQIQMTVSVCSDLALSFAIFITPSLCCIMLLLVMTASFSAFFPYCWDVFVWLSIILYGQLGQFLIRLVWFSLCFVSGFIGFRTIVKFSSWSLEWHLFTVVALNGTGTQWFQQMEGLFYFSFVLFLLLFSVMFELWVLSVCSRLMQFSLLHCRECCQWIRTDWTSGIWCNNTVPVFLYFLLIFTVERISKFLEKGKTS